MMRFDLKKINQVLKNDHFKSPFNKDLVAYYTILLDFNRNGIICLSSFHKMGRIRY